MIKISVMTKYAGLVVAFICLCGIVKIIVKYKGEAKEALCSGALCIVIISSVLFFAEIVKKIKYSKEQHHSGMDIEQTKEKP